MTIFEDIKSRIDIVDLVGEKVTLKKSGHAYMGFCPFHNNTKTASFAVFTRTQTWRCFGTCNEGGDIFSFIMKQDGVTFAEALQTLAVKANISLDNSPEATQKRQRLHDEFELRQIVAFYYYKCLMNSQQAQAYWRRRGFWDNTFSRMDFGYSDGKLTEHLSRLGLVPLALELNLLGKDELTGKVYDIFRNGYATYTIRAKSGLILSFEGRAIDPVMKPPHKRLGDKHAGWSMVNPREKMLVIMEGRADALSWNEWGFNALSLGGVNVAGLDKKQLSHFTDIYFVADNDKTGHETLDKLAMQLGGLIKIAPLPQFEGYTIKDSNDLLKLGVSRYYAERALKLADVYLDLLIERAKAANGGEYDELLKQIFSLLPDLNELALLRYKKIISKELNISTPDFNSYVKAIEKPTETEEEFELEFRTAKDMYRVVRGRTFLLKQDRDGTSRPELLIEADLKIEQVIHRIGAEESKELFISCQQANGHTPHKMPAATVKLTDFEGMKWITNTWPLLGIRPPVKDNSGYLREAIQVLSAPSQKFIFEHTGHRTIDGQRTFLSNSGALGYKGKTNISVDLSLDRAETNMKLFDLPLEPTNIAEAWRFSLSLWDKFGEVGILLWAVAHLAPMKPLLNPTFLVMLYARTNSFKSTIATLFQSFFGTWTEHGSKDGWKYLAGSFRSTMHSIIKNSYLAKDCMYVVDDFFPRQDNEMKIMVNVLVELIRGAGNSAGRDRLKGGQRFQTHSDKPRGITVVTAEELPLGKLEESDLARVIGYPIRMWMDKDDPELTKFMQTLNESYDNGDLLRHGMAAFILDLNQNWDDLKADLPVQEAKNLALFNKSRYPRQPESFAKLMTAVQTGLAFAVQCGAITMPQATKRQQQAMAALQNIMEAYGGSISQADPTTQFIETLRDKLDDQWILAKNQIATEMGEGSYEIKLNYGEELAGYKDDEYIYLKPEYFKLVLMDKFKPIGIGLNTMYERLAMRGWLVRGSDGKASITRYIRHKNTSVRLIHIPIKVVYPELESQ